MGKKRFKRIDLIPIIGGILAIILVFYEPARAWSVMLMQNNPVAFYVFIVGGISATFLTWLLTRIKKVM